MPGTMLNTFIKQLEIEPYNLQLRGIFTDFLQEQDNPLEKAQRWMVEHKRYPMHYKGVRKTHILWGIEGCSFEGLYQCRLPEELFKKIMQNNEYWIYCTSIEEADKLLASAL